MFKLALAKGWSLQPHGELNLLTRSFSVPELNAALCTDPEETPLLQTPLPLAALQTPSAAVKQVQL